nr:metal-dependent transcriptional regulator [Candidatus Njordarchaeota archaeon]
MAETKATEVVEEYLEAIYKLQSKDRDGARTSDLTKSLKVVPGTVTNTIERLEREGYVEHEPYKGVKLTEKGRAIALQVVRRHRLSERLLTDLLRVESSKAHEVACRIEHGIADEEIVKKIEEALGNPRTCPHGNPIPERDGKSGGDDLEAQRLTTLADLQSSDTGIVMRFEEDDPEALRCISSLGIKLGVSVAVIRKESTVGTVTVRVGDAAIHTISEKVASDILVMKMKQAEREIVGSNGAIAPPNQRSTFGEYES